MAGQKGKAVSEKRGWRITAVYVTAGFLTMAAALVIILYARRGPTEAKAGNVVADTSSSAVVQGGHVESITVYNGSPAPQASPAASPQAGRDQPPSPTPTVMQPQPTPESSPAPRPQPPASQAPLMPRQPSGNRDASADTADSGAATPNAYRRCGVEYNRDGEIVLSSGWSIKTLSFFARYTAAGTEERQTTSYYFFSGEADRPAGEPEEPKEPKKPFLMAFRVPGEEREESDVAVYPGFAREFEADGCFYTFTVTHVSGGKISYSFRGTGPLRPVVSR